MTEKGNYGLSKLLLLLLLVLVAICLALVGEVNGNVNLTFVSNAVEKGALCNDGSAAAYYYDPGFGDGINNWFITLQGGAWCYSDKTCSYRLNNSLGSSKYYDQNVFFGQIKSTNRTVNPDFYNWNRIVVEYCDSSSFMGNASHPKIISKGAQIFYAIVQELLDKGMANAQNAILSGTSAGGLSAILHCDDFKALLPHTTTRLKCLIDSGFFIHARKLHGSQHFAEYLASVASYHGFTHKLPHSCTSKMNACIFPQYIIKNIKTPLFLVQSKFDVYQLATHYEEDPTFLNCMLSLRPCTTSQLHRMRDYGVAMSKIVKKMCHNSSTSIEMFIHPCLRHGHFFEKSGWGASYKLRNQTIQEAVGDWFYDRSSSLFQEIDAHKYPLSSNCTNTIIHPKS